MKKTMLAMVGCVLAAGFGCMTFKTDCPVAVSVSMDGRNSIRLYVEPLAYEVLRDGIVMVAKSEIGMKVDGQCLAAAAKPIAISMEQVRGFEPAPIYKKKELHYCHNETVVDFGDWAVRLAARDDGVAYRFETKKAGEITVNCEKATVTIPNADDTCWTYFGGGNGCEEVPNETHLAKDLVTTGKRVLVGGKDEAIYLPFVYAHDGKTVAVTESDVYDYPVWNLTRAVKDDAKPVMLDSKFCKWPTKMMNNKREERAEGVRRMRNWIVTETTDYLVKTEGTRTFPWRTFVLADAPAKLCEAEIVNALARPAAKGVDFSWVKPGKVTWEWWNAWDNEGDPRHSPNKHGCTTEVYKRFFDLAAEYGVEYVIFDEGWSKELDIWNLNPSVDLKYLIDYGNRKGVGTILWMAWAQIDRQEAKVAEHFAKLGAAGFKVDFMDRGDAEAERFLWKFADECAKRKLVIDYHGAHHPTGMSRAYPNVLNYEGIHGLEMMKFYRGEDFMHNDVSHFFCRFTAGPADYTPGAMKNYPIGGYPKKGNAQGIDTFVCPGSLGTRCHQIALMSLYEAPLQMLCDSVKNYRANAECFKYMAAVPVVWDDTIGLGGDPDSYAAVARKAKNGDWYAAAITDTNAREVTIDTAFLKDGQWQAEIFRDAADCDVNAEHYVHERRTVKAGEKLTFKLARGGGVSVRFVK